MLNDENFLTFKLSFSRVGARGLSGGWRVGGGRIMWMEEVAWIRAGNP